MVDTPRTSFMAYNVMDEKKNMLVAMPFSFDECSCSATRLDPACNKYYVGMHYGEVCKQLGFTPNDQIYLSGVVPALLKVVYPWEDYNAIPALTEASYGSKDDHDLVSNPFSWVDHTHPIVYVPVHKFTSARVGFQACTFYLK